jgi:hypothetical protein
MDVVFPTLSPITPNQAALQTINADLPAAWDIWQLDFRMQNITLAMIQELRILANDTPIVRASGATIDFVNQYCNAPAYGAAGILTWFFRRLGIRGGAQSFDKNSMTLISGSAKDLGLETSLNCGSFDGNGFGVRGLRVEIDLINTAVGAASVQITARVTDPVPGGAGLVRRFEKQTVNVAANSQYVAAKNNLLFGDPLHQLLNMLHLVPAGGTLDQFVIRHNGMQKFIRTDAYNRIVQAQDNLRTPQAGIYSIDFTERGYGDEFLQIGNPGTDLQLQFTPDANGNVNIFQDSIGVLG